MKFGIYQLCWHFPKKQEEDEEGNEDDGTTKAEENDSEDGTYDNKDDNRPRGIFPGPAIILPPHRQLDECIVEDASDEENEDDISTVSSLPDFTPIEMFPTSDTAYSTPKRVHQLDEYIEIGRASCRERV